MALSQLQCLDDNHVNPRTHESKVEFLYCEEQRHALEALLRDGREAFAKCLRDRGLRGFLSDPEQEALTGAAEPYDPGSELFQEDAGDDEPPLSLHYWPELSDTSEPQMDLGWPDCDSYRGVTRTTVYAQPPLDGQAHIKEVVRKMIAQAQKVIAVVMDAFTDVDIFRDLLDAGFKRKVSVYILLERTGLPHFLSMCQRANMHPGHFKHLRVRCTEGAEFCTRSSTRVRGQLGHRFMFVDGDKAVSGSYSFTWMSSRLDRNLITVVTGQAVDAFDRLFRFLFMTSSSVDLRQVTLEPEPEPEPLPPPPTVITPSAADVRKMYNPKYALVAAGNPSLTPSAGQSSPKESQPSGNSKNPDNKKKKSKDALQEAPPLHPGLIHLEKVYLTSYLPTWPEPDPPSDVIGFINIRDTSKPTQFNVQRSEMFGTSQAIRFSSPFSAAKEVLPAVAQLRQVTPKHEVRNKLQPSENKAKAEESAVDGVRATPLSAEAPEEKSSTSGQRAEPGSRLCKALNTSTPNTDTAQSFTTGSPEPRSLPGSNAGKDAGTSSNAQSAAVHKTHSPELSGPADSNSEQRTQTKTGVSHTGSPTQAVLTQTHNSSEVTPNTQTPTAHSSSSASPVHPQPVSSTSLSENKHTACPTVDSRTATSVCTPVPSSSCSSSVPPLISSSTTVQLRLPQPSASSSLTLIPPVPKPRTIHLVFKVAGASDGQSTPGSSVVRIPESLAGTGRTAARSEPDAANVSQSRPESEPEAVSQRQGNGGTQRDTEITVDPEEQNVTPRERKGEETIGLRGDRAATQSAAGIKAQARSDVLTTDAPNLGAHQPQRISYCELNPAVVDVLETVDSSKASTTHTFVPATTKSRTPTDSGGHSIVTSAPNMTNAHTGIPAQESQQTPKARGSSHTPERPQYLSLSNTHTPDEREPQQLPSLVHTTDPRRYTPDLRTPTPDGYISSREDSTLSTTSEEYYECCDSPLHDGVFDQAGFNSYGTTAAPGSPLHMNNTTCASMLGEMDGNETQSHRESTAVIEKDGKAQPQAASRKRLPNQSATLVDGGGTPGESANKAAEIKRRSTEGSSDGVKERVVDGAALRPSGAQSRHRPQSPRETEGPEPPRRQQQDGGASSPSPRGPAPPLAVGAVVSAAGREQVEVSRGRQRLLPRQPPVAESRARAAQSQDRHSYTRGPDAFLHTRLNIQSHLRPRPQESVHRQGEGKAPFALTFSRLYNLKGLKDKMSKGGSTNSQVQGRKSTS